MQNTISNARFPFGQPLKPVKQQDRSPKKVFVLGVYASAVHAKWLASDGKQLCQALAVASEPEIFWRGENAEEVISKIAIPPEAGSLKQAEGKFNGPSGKALDELYLAPLGLTRADAWLCDLVPHSLLNQGQSEAIQKHYAPMCEKHGLPTASIPAKPTGDLIDENRRNEILAELKESRAETIILLGEEPLKWFLSAVSDCKKTRLAEFGNETATYGSAHTVSIDGKAYSVTPLTHMRQAGGFGSHSDEWERLHAGWVESVRKPA